MCTATGEGMDPNNMSRTFRRLIEGYAAARPEAPLSDGIGLHSLRHTFASNLVANGTNLKVAATAMRHSSTRLMDRYSHLVASTVTEAIRGLAAEVGS